MRFKIIVFIGVCSVGLVALTLLNRKIAYYVGGFLLHTGYFIQDSTESFHHQLNDSDPVHPNEIYKTVIAQNILQAKAWKATPALKDRKPKALIIMCIDPRLNSSRILGDTRGYYDVIRIPGSVITEEVAEAVELAVTKHETKLVMVITHTDCAMEHLAASDEGKHHYPLLAEGINNHAKRMQSLSHRPAILDRLQKQQLWVIEKRLDTKTGKFF
jgi:carbonic anhydrase